MGSVRGPLVGFLVGASFVAGIIPKVSAFSIVSFDGHFTRWNRSEIPYVVDSRGSRDFTDGCDAHGPCVSVNEAIEQSFATWSAVPGTNVVFTEAPSKAVSSTGYDQENDIIWIHDKWLDLPFSPPSAALAVTITTYKTSNKEIVDSDIHFNGEFFHWGVINSPEEETANVVDIQNIATHEIGHFIGLNHSSEDIFETNEKLYLATMFFASGPGEVFRRTLRADDLAAVNNLYPDGAAVAPEVDEIFPKTIDATAGTAVSIRFTGSHFGDSTSVVLVNANGQEDLTGKILTLSETELNVAFETYGLKSGDYDVIVSNSFESVDRLEKGLAVSGGYGSAYSNTNSDSGETESSGGGCSLTPASNSGLVSATGLFAVLLPLLLIAIARLQLMGRMMRQEVPPNPRRRPIRS